MSPFSTQLCELVDIYSVIRSCRLLRQRIRQHESHIAQAYLHVRRQQNKYTTEVDIEIDPSPGDDLAFIADLFPPPPPQYTNNNSMDDRPDYSFGYMADLTRCWTTCIRLSYYLAEYVVQQHLQADQIVRQLWSSSKTEKELVYSKGVGRLQSQLLSSIAYLILFLETTATTTDHLTQVQVTRHESLQTQESILQQPPFSSTQVLLSAHHCMHLLCSTVRRMMAPEIPPSSTEHWLSLLLTTSTLERILDFFIAAAADESAKGVVAGNPRASFPPAWTRRMEFMWRMRRDWGEFVGGGSSGAAAPPPRLDEIWFEAARRELRRRGAIPHRCEAAVPILHGSVVVLRCELCDDGG
ncbi:hypothetical protein FE257_000393 [Aspergillus nanangensis]|uniref:Uncharacterized protein n=1 Tax=Aspergillus nanangensis TaxID=2582783 RepID=A0AAD4CU80_ASPNN|nr:hypothetical protein FE257_000393 [Aspergillus nanangensis]